MKILISDDDNINHVIIKRLLINSEIEVISSYDGDESYNMACELLPDLIVTDIIRPGSSGYELCELIKKNKKQNTSK